MVLRVDRGLIATLHEIAARLFDETGHEYSLASIVRGLSSLGILTVADAAALAPLFVGSRIARGRKKGTRCPPVADLELGFEDGHHDAHERREVVARPPRP
jgi:hypothetical protein